MDKIIFIKYGELGTKKGNINFFINILYQNISHKLKDYNVSINKSKARIYIEVHEDNEQIIIEELKEVFGIQSIVLAYRIGSNYEEISDRSLEIMKTKDVKSFKVITKRPNKTFEYDSMEVNDLIGSHILKHIPGLKVDIHQPEYSLQIEIRSAYTYIYIEEIKGLGGYPYGINGKGILMLSGGIDSPVAGFLSLKRGVEIECLYFHSPPHTSKATLNKVIKLCEILSKYAVEIKLHVVPFTDLQDAIYKNVIPPYMITIMRRMMYRIGLDIAKQQKAHILINGESIGQVASQTLTSMSVINSVTNIPVIRPLACFDKLEIIDIAKRIGTYETSILPYEDCCTVFVPPHPIINPNEEKCIEEEKKFNYKQLMHVCIDNIKTIIIEPKIINKELL